MPLALSVAREHCDWCALQGFTPSETLAAVGLRPRLLERFRGASWGYVEQEIAKQWVSLRRGLTDNTWREAA
jgi:hypothetical protein